MSTLAQRAEAALSEYGYLQKILPEASNVITQAVSQAAVSMAQNLKDDLLDGHGFPYVLRSLPDG